MPDTFSTDFVCLQISPLETVILHNFWDIHPNSIGKHAQVKHFANGSAKQARLTTIKPVKPPDKKPGISDRSSLLRRRSVKFQFAWQKRCYNIPLAELLQFKSMLAYVMYPQNAKIPSCVCAMCLMVL